MNRENSKSYSLSLIAIAVSALVAGCGGGGGGSQSPNNPATSTPTPTNNNGGTTTPPVTPPVTTSVAPPVTTPVVPPVTPPVIPPVTPPVTPPLTPPVTPPLLNVADPSNALAAHAAGITGRNVTVGVVDTDIDTTTTEFGGRVVKTVYTPGGANGSTHGTEVTQALASRLIGVAPEALVQAAAAGTPGGTGSDIAISSQIYTDLFAKGVRIVNQSMTVGSLAAPGTTGTSLHTMFAPFVAQNGLFVWATGNEGSKQPALSAALPSLFPDIQKGWIAVTAVNALGGTAGFSSTDTVPGEISSYANRCGVAANWCLAAPGDFVSTTTGTRVFGTSFATPAVTGAAALVQQAYPWMDGSTIRQTLLSTATDMHDTATYGWGLLNASKAVNGPALFDTRLTLGGSFVANFDAITSVFKNDIGGDTGLDKSGTGVLNLAGNDTYTGDTNVKGGTVNVTGAIASRVNISSGANLSGNGGTVHNSVNNQGRVSSVGTGLSVDGNYTAAAGSTLANEINSTFKVGGIATIANSHLITTTPAGTSDPSGYVTSQVGVPNKVLTAAGGVVGQFTDLAFEANSSTFVPGTFIQAALTYKFNEVDMAISRTNIQSFAVKTFGADATRVNTGANVEKALKAADAMVATGNTAGSNAQFLSSAAALQKTATVAAAAQVLDSLSGQIHASAQALTFQQSDAVNRDLSNRLAQLGNEHVGREKTGLWASTIGASGKLSESGFSTGDTSLWGGQFGVDTHLNDKTIIGAAVAYSDGRANFDRFGGQSKSQNTGVSVYGRYALANDGAYVAGRVGEASVSSTVKRTALIGNSSQDLSASHSDSVLSGYVETGYALPVLTNTSVTPFAGISYDRVKRNAFTESGSAFGLTAAGQTYHQTAGLLGARAISGFTWTGGKSFLQGYAAVQHAFTSGNLDFTAAFNGAADASFTVQGIGLQKTTGAIGFGITTAVDQTWSWFANYDAQFGKNGLKNNIVSAGIRINLK